MRVCTAQSATSFSRSLVLRECLLGTEHEGSKGHDWESIKAWFPQGCIVLASWIPGSFLSTTIAEITFKTTGLPLPLSFLPSHLKSLIPPLLACSCSVRLFLPLVCRKGKHSGSLMGCLSLWAFDLEFFVQVIRTTTCFAFSFGCPESFQDKADLWLDSHFLSIPVSYLTVNLSIDPILFCKISSPWLPHTSVQLPLPEFKFISLLDLFLSFFFWVT